MAVNASDIIVINRNLSAKGLSYANFASACVFAPKTDTTTLGEDVFKTYQNIQEVGNDFLTTTETYKACAVLLGAEKKLAKVTVYVRKADDADWATTLNKARDSFWWFWTIVTKPIYEQKSDVLAIAKWSNENGSMFIDCQSDQNATDIRDQTKKDDIVSELTKAGYRLAFTASHLTDAYSGLYLAKHFCAVNYTGTNTTITGEFKKSSGLIAEDLKGSEITAMNEKGCTYYTQVDLQGSTDMGRWLNTVSHSTYGEFIDDVVNLEAMINALTVAIYNVLGGATTKVPQTPVGQALILNAVKKVCDQYVTNGFLGARNYIDPNDAQEKFTLGYEILTKPEDILTMSDDDRKNRRCAPISVMVFRAGAIHSVKLELNVF